MNESKNPPDRLSTAKTLVAGIALGLAFELVTCVFRFGLDMQSTRDTRWISYFTFGFRVHHGYIGALILLIGFLFFSPTSGYRSLIRILAYALILSDLLHHFAVLWPITGDPQFDIRYP